tara:strand:+ start:39992 stop:41305 length:1314 start_codon:yes stop_codon:yes gene_type:complete
MRFLISLFLVFIVGSPISIAKDTSTNKSEVKQILSTINKYWKDQSIQKQLDYKHLKHLNENELIQLHLQLVVEKLITSPNPLLSEKQMHNRLRGLNKLQCYLETGIFPINTKHAYRIPYFIDDFGTACAVGHMIIESGEKALAQKIASENNYKYLEEMDYPEMLAWANENGFTLEELKWIQPAYQPQCPLGTYRHPKCHNDNGCINPDFRADSLIPPYQTLVEYNDGLNGWVTDTNGSFLQFFGARPGDHRITVTDSLNQTRVYLYTINNPAEIIINYTISPPSDSVTCNAEVNFQIYNAASPITYQLYSPSLQIFSTNNNGSFDSLCAGDYTIVVRDSNYCQVGDVFSIDLLTSLESQSIKEIKTYPNPFNNLLFIETSSKSPIDYRIYDISGKLIESNQQLNSNQISTEHLSKGIYFFDFTLDEKRYRRKMIKSN